MLTVEKMAAITIFVIAFALLIQPFVSGRDNKHLQAHAIVTNAQNHSTFECWQFVEPVTISSVSGAEGAAVFSFPNTKQADYTTIPARFDGGLHNAPVPQLVVPLAGLAHVTLPIPTHEDSSMNELWVVGGGLGAILALDTEGLGHISTYPSDQPTVILQMPFGSIDDIPAHKVVSTGPCHFSSAADQLV